MTENILLFLELLEKVLLSRNLDQELFVDEFEKSFNLILQGIDNIDVFELNEQNISETLWEERKKQFLEDLKK